MRKSGLPDACGASRPPGGGSRKAQLLGRQLALPARRERVQPQVGQRAGDFVPRLADACLAEEEFAVTELGVDPPLAADADRAFERRGPLVGVTAVVIASALRARRASTTPGIA